MLTEGQVRQEIALFESAHPVASQDIDTIWIVSSFGTYIQPILRKHPLWGAWFDQKNIAKAILLALEITSSRTGKRVQDLTQGDTKESGPNLIYNGEYLQNIDLEWAITCAAFPIYRGKVSIVYDVKEGRRKRRIANTLDQFLSFPAEILDKDGGTIAIVGSAPHFSRILRYNNMHRPIPDGYRIKCFPVPSYEAAREFADQ